MAKNTQSQNHQTIPTKLAVDKESFTKKVVERIELGEQLLNEKIIDQEQLDEAKQNFYNWNDYNSELLKQSFNKENNEYRSSYNNVNGYYGFLPEERQASPLKEFEGKLHNKINNLKQLLDKIDLLKTDNQTTIQTSSKTDTTDKLNTDIFIVHGHNTEVKVTVARTLEKLNLNPIILHEKANSGKTVIEKFEKHSNVGFAIVLLTDDDLGKAKSDNELNFRARQNVILELGYFIGKLGRNKVCTLYAEGVELPSDINGLLYIKLDNSEHWKIDMAKELKASGYNIDINKII